MNKSESIKEISIALSQLGAELGNATKNSTNPFFKSKYADLASILNYVKPELARYGLSVIQSSKSGANNKLVIQTLLTHISGEWIETEIELPGEGVKNLYNPQTVGSAYTYGRRYGLSAALNISSEEDNDGNQPPESPKPPEKPKETVKPIGDYSGALNFLTKTCDTTEKIDYFTKHHLNGKTWATGEREKLLQFAAEKKQSLGTVADRVANEFDGEITNE